MFERFTEQARHVIVSGQDEARRLRHNYLGSEHLLLGLLSVEGVHRGVLYDHGLTLPVVRERVRHLVPMGAEVTIGQIPMTPRAKAVLELSLRKALEMGHGYIAPFHILLGLQADGVAEAGNARRILDEAGASPEVVKERVEADLVSHPEATLEAARHKTAIGFESLRPRTGSRCEQALSLYGALFVCQSEQGHDGQHLEHGDGWAMRWERE